MDRLLKVNSQMIRQHTGGICYQLGLDYFSLGELHGRQVECDTIHARVQGRQDEPYAVVIGFQDGEIVHSTCTCHAATACEHVAAVLMDYAVAYAKYELVVRPQPGPGPVTPVAPMAAPDQAQATEPTPTPIVAKVVDPDGPWPEHAFANDKALQEWGRAQLIDDMLRSPIYRIVPGADWKIQHHYASVQELLLEGRPSRHGKALYLPIQGLQRAVLEALRTTSIARRQRMEFARDAVGFRATPPAEAELVPLWRWLSDAPPSTSLWGSDSAAPPSAALFDVDSSTPAIRVEVEGEFFAKMVEVAISPTGSTRPYPSRMVVERVLDLLTHPALANSDVRRRLVAEAKVPTWQRALHDADKLVKELMPLDPSSADEQLPGWRIQRTAHGYEVTPVTCAPYKTRDGLKTAKVELRRQPLPLPQDRAIAPLLQADAPLYDPVQTLAFRNRVVAQLVGHPRVVGEDGLVIAVRSEDLHVVWQPTEEGGVQVFGNVGVKRLSAGELLEVVRHTAGELSTHLDLQRRRLSVLSLSNAQAALLDALIRHGDTFPPESRMALLEQFEPLSAVLPMELRGELRGTPAKGDPRPLVRMALGVDGALELTALSRPLDGLRPWPPGRGPAEISFLRDGERVFVARDLSDEVQRFRHALAPLRLPEREDFRWVLADGDDGLHAALTLRDLDDVRVEWAKAPPRISRRATASDLTLRGATKRDWFGLEGGLDVDGVIVSLSELLDAVRTRRRFVSVGENGWVALTDELAHRLEATAALAKSSKSGVDLPPLAAAVLLDLEEDGATITIPKQLRVQLDRIAEASGLAIELPEALNAELRPYQLEGFRWLARLAHWAPGAVLADDMGLGKTIQAITLLLRRASEGPALVVAPASVGVNWSREVARFAPSLRVHDYRGPDRERALNDLQPGDVLITSWELMTRDAAALAVVGFATVVLDEAQAIKNPQTRRAQASAELRAAFTLALTGTPVENRVGEIWSLMRTVVPGLLGPAARFREHIILPIERDGDATTRRALSALLRPFLLRRLKSEVARDLPSRTDSRLEIELSVAERRRYDAFRAASIAALHGDDLGEDSGERNRFQVLAALTRLRQLACHPGLVDPDEVGIPSTKVARLVHMLTDLKEEGHKALVFSQFTQLLGLARTAIEAAGLRIRYLDGSTPIQQRQAEVDAFQAGDGDAFLISLKAGGTGLNLTAASYVFHLDPWWNPAVEDQATDRAHRIGQTQPVTVFRMVAVDTIEEMVLDMHDDKRALVADLLEGTGKTAALSTTELLAVLRSSGAQMAIGADMPTAVEKAEPRTRKPRKS